MAKHNKKRNVGLIHEQLVRYASERIVECDEDRTQNAISILNNHFKEGSELYKEFRLFNALVHTKVQSSDIARRIILESKAACQNHNSSDLRTEKSLLIKIINHELDEKRFYNRKISEYKVFATVQALLNEWRGSNRLAPDEIVKYESSLEKWLTRDSEIETLTKKSDADPLALKLMIEKFNKKYLAHFNKEQTRLLEYKLLDDNEAVKKHVAEIKQRAEIALSNFYRVCDNDILNRKQTLVENRIYSMKVNASDETVKKALMLSSLIEQLEDNND
jgi:hypothetical protein